MLNLIYTMKIFGHRSVESFKRELLSRNSQLKIACGLIEGIYKYCGDRKHLQNNIKKIDAKITEQNTMQQIHVKHIT